MSLALPWIEQPQTFDERNSECHIYTYKEGLLSAVAHDLKILMARFEIKVQADQSIEARFWPDTCEVLGAVDSQGQRLPNALKDKDLKQIKKNIQKDVLHTRKHPVISFRGYINETSIKGQLELKGKRNTVVGELSSDDREDSSTLLITFQLKPSQWGIAPYKALLGAIRLQDRVTLQWSYQIKT